MPALRVLPKAASLVFPRSSFTASAKKARSLGLEPGHPLDVVHPESGELLGDPELIDEAEGNSLPLRAVTKGGVVEKNRSRTTHESCHDSLGNAVLQSR